jgi:hypothetical protein
MVTEYIEVQPPTSKKELPKGWFENLINAFGCLELLWGKRCAKCKKTLPLSEFYRSKGKGGGRQSHCKECRAVITKAWDLLHKEEQRVKSKVYALLHKKEIAAKAAAWYSINGAAQLAYQKANRAHITAVQRLRKGTDLGFRLRLNLRKRLGAMLRGGFKAGSSVDDLGCSVEELRAYLAEGFWPDMGWDRWNKKADGINLDHIVPLYEFDLTDRGQFLVATHYTNLQMLWKDDNGTKKNRLDWTPAESKHLLPGWYLNDPSGYQKRVAFVLDKLLAIRLEKAA